jgi:hypothetical protein
VGLPRHSGSNFNSVAQYYVICWIYCHKLARTFLVLCYDCKQLLKQNRSDIRFSTAC